MRVWETIKNWGRGLMQRAATATGEAANQGFAGFAQRAKLPTAQIKDLRRGTAAHEYKDIFELVGVPAFRAFYEAGIFPWKQIYRGAYRAWHVVPAPTVQDPKATRQLFRLNAAKAVCAELAGLVWSEACELRVATEGWTEVKDENGVVTNPDPLNAFVHDVLRRNAFTEKFQELIEQELALGGAASKVWAELPQSASQTAPSEREPYVVRIGYAMADQFIPLSWDNARVYEGVFVSRTVKGGYYFTRLEWHRWIGGAYVITNDLYRSDIQRGAISENQDILGVKCGAEELARIYPGLEPETVVPVDDSLFTYWRTPIANNLDDNSPLGVSVYGNALETLHAIDICYDSLVTEFRLGRKRIVVPARFLRSVVDPQTGLTRRYFDPTDEAFVGVADDDGTAGIHDISAELRVEEHVAALNALLSVLCLQLGFSANTFSFDTSGGLKTATEVVSENSKTFKTVKTVQNQLRPALEHLVKNIIDVAVLYDMTWQGQSVASLVAGGYEVKVTFDDGVTQDRQTNINEGVMLVDAGLLSKFTFLTDRKYGQGLTEAEALAELDRIRGEQQPAVADDDSFFKRE